MNLKSPFTVDIGKLLNQSVDRIDLNLKGNISGIESRNCAVLPDRDILVLVVIERIRRGVICQGTVRSFWDGECSRCLEHASVGMQIDFKELFVTDPDIETEYELIGDKINFIPLVSELLIVELPLIPLCKVTCKGLCQVCGVNLNMGSCSC
jgi:uncharacterized protein